jgi:hypothetical protein
MSDLTGKFSSFEEQITAQHTELMEALNTIAFALGAPPTTPTTTLADVSDQLGSILALLENNATRDTGYYNTSLSELGMINNNLDLIITNNSLNAQRLIAAIYATFCECATDAPLLSPPLDVTPTEIINDDKCRRIQFYLSVFGNWLNKIANYGASGAAITSSTLTTLLQLVVADAGIVATGAEVGAAGGIPGIVVGAVVGLIAVAAYTIGGSWLIDYANQFNDPTLRDNMVQAMYAATNADEGYTAFKSTLLAGMDTIPAEVIYSLWWSAWSNDVYSGSPVVDDSAFDGSICAPDSPCDEVTSNNIISNEAGTFYVIDPADPYPPNAPTFNQGNYNGYTITLISANRTKTVVVGAYNLSGSYFGVGSLVNQFDTCTVGYDTLAIGYYSETLAGDGHYTLQICAPDEL